MEFVIWACRVVHILSAIVLLGGMVYYNAVFTPVADYEGAFSQDWMRAVDQRFQGFIWSTVWPMLVTGVILLLMQPNLSSISFVDLWTWMMAVKILAFFSLVFFSWQMGIVVDRMKDALGEDEESFEGWLRAYRLLMKRSITSGIVAVLASGALGVV
jgi:uncharacterized membrane protein